MSQDRWAEVAGVFVDKHYASARGRVRTALIDRQIRDHTGGARMRIVDVGGGAGNQSIHWARDGHEVTVVDSSEEMRRRASLALLQEPPEAAHRVRVVDGDALHLAGVIEPGSYDVAMCHGVIMYFEDPAPLIGQLAAAVRRGGVVSVVAKNRDSLAVRPALERDWVTAITAFDAEREINRLGFDARADSPEALSEVYTAAGLEPLAWYGVRLFTEGWGDDEQATAEEWPTLVESEYQAGRRDPYRRLCRLFHLLGRKH